MRYHFSFIRYPSLRISTIPFMIGISRPCLQKLEPRPPGANSPCQYIRPLTSAAVLASIKPSICPQHAKHLAKVANARITVARVLYFFKCE